VVVAGLTSPASSVAEADCDWAGVWAAALPAQMAHAAVNPNTRSEILIEG
jgi:hypothetical protein